jgi:hypothetical protein
MNSRITSRKVLFFVQDGHIVRIVATPSQVRGATGQQQQPQDRTYTHRCRKQTLETVAHALAETPAEGAGTSLAEIAEHENLPFTQVNVALEFLKERGLVDIRHRRCFPATEDVYLDAMVEYYALANSDKMV